jgi:hypothetical protein
MGEAGIIPILKIRKWQQKMAMDHELGFSLFSFLFDMCFIYMYR